MIPAMLAAMLNRGGNTAPRTARTGMTGRGSPRLARSIFESCTRTCSSLWPAWIRTRGPTDCEGVGGSEPERREHEGHQHDRRRRHAGERQASPDACPRALRRPVCAMRSHTEHGTRPIVSPDVDARQRRQADGDRVAVVTDHDLPPYTLGPLQRCRARPAVMSGHSCRDGEDRVRPGCGGPGGTSPEPARRVALRTGVSARQ